MRTSGQICFALFYNTSGAMSLASGPTVCDNSNSYYYDHHNHYDFAITTGDVNGDGQLEVAAVWSNYQGDLQMQIYTINQSSNSLVPVGSGPTQIASSAATEDYTSALNLAAGDYNGDGADEIAVAASLSTDSNIWAYLYLVSVTNSLQTITPSAPLYYLANGVTGSYFQSAVTTAYYPADPLGLERLFFTFGNACQYDSDYASCLILYAINVSGGPGAVSISSGPYLNIVTCQCFNTQPVFVTAASQSLTGTVNATQIVVATNNNYPSGSGNVYIFQPSSDWSSISLLTGPVSLPPGSVAGTPTVALGDFAGRSTRLGQPVYNRYLDVLEVQAVVNAPPASVNVTLEITAMDPVSLNINYNLCNEYIAQRSLPCATANYLNQSGQSTSLTVNHQVGYSLSGDWSLTIGDVEEESSYVQAAVNWSRGKEWQQTNNLLESTSIQISSYAQTDDVVVYTETDYDTWEYPILNENGQITGAYLLIMYPVYTCTTSIGPCQVNTQPTVAGGKHLPWYYPTHEPGNILSYPQSTGIGIGPSDVQTPVVTLSNVGVDVGSSQTYNQSSVSSTDVLTAGNWSVGGSFTAQASTPDFFGEFGIASKFSLSGNYTNSSSATTETGFNDSTFVSLVYGPLLPGTASLYLYNVQPYLYWTPGNYLKLDYQVDTSTNTQGYWSTGTYGLIDPSFNLPDKYDQCNSSDPDCWRLSKDFRFDPPAPIAGMPATVTLRISENDLTQGGTPLAPDISVPPIAAQSFVTVQTQITPKDAGCQRVYGTLDPANQVPQIHVDNNVAWGVMSVLTTTNVIPPVACTSGNAAAGSFTVQEVAGHSGPARISLMGLSTNSPASGTGQLAAGAHVGPDGTVYVTATVEATGGHFAYVPIAFYASDPAGGAQLLHMSVIPAVWSGITNTATFRWHANGRYFGDQTVYAVLGGQGVNATHLGNRRASLKVHLPEAAHRVFMLIMARSGSGW